MLNVSPQEQADLDVMRAAIERLKLSCYDGQLSLTRMPPEQLVHTGHKTVGDGLLYYVRSTQRKIDSLIATHLQKYPD